MFVFIDKVDSFCRDGKGYVLVRFVSLRLLFVQLFWENNELSGVSYFYVLIEFDVEKGEDIVYCWVCFYFVGFCIKIQY